MSECTFQAMGTTWWLRIDPDPDGASAGGAGTPDADAGETLAEAEALVASLEARLSRFRPDSVLSRLNRDRAVDDHLLAGILREARGWRRRSRGAFDVTVGAAMLASGYDRTFDAIEPGRAVGADAARPCVVLDGDHVWLEGDGSLDLGGIAKGWTVDRVAELLRDRGASAYVVDGGGDIRAGGGEQVDGGAWPIGVGDAYVVVLRDGAVATSSTLHRRWTTSTGTAHHIIDPAQGAPTRGALETAVVIADDATTADVLATAVIVDVERGMEAARGAHAEVMVRTSAGAWEMTPGFGEYLR